MGDAARSVLARLKNKAKESGRSYQLCLQLFCQEEFLRRLEKSKYVDNLVLKGGLFLYSLTEFDSRVTVDVDFLLKRIPNTPEQLRKVVEEIIVVETGNGFVGPVINTYSIETTVAEKIDAILSLMEFSSRMKDYYDIYYLSHKFDFEGEVLCEALSKTFTNREHNFTIEQFKQIMTFDSDDGMQKKWKAFTKKIDVKMEEFPTILQSINEFLWEPYTAVIKETIFQKHWDANECSWN